MQSSAVYDDLIRTRDNLGAGFLLLIDPDKNPVSDFLPMVEAARDCGVDAILVGTSFTLYSDFGRAVKEIKSVSTVPVIIFPGSFAQITPDADAILFTSLISGRNPSYLIEEQVKGAPFVKKFGLEPIPTGYMLIESGPLTSVQYLSNSMPIPRSKHDIACAHALAAQYLGMRLVYLEAGSGAAKPVPVEMVRAVSSYVNTPVVVGGGLCTPEDCAARIEAGASFVVIGNHLEGDGSFGQLRELTAATHTKDSIRI
ncbi:MAG: geranylgeranylglyceryl/heptaprenylglyceryl phosphate synthase [Candidatus Zixiibacteriota bacterium]|nr:MAG: geranylgeranylglyceryl/heptaprenylglyceryl phosphate synthase [candidate division Zixibacteria bacterium]